jgi:hypothetical protein
MGKCRILLAADLFSTKKAIEKKHTSLIGLIFTIILFVGLLAYGMTSGIKSMNTPFIWESKIIKNSQEFTGKFQDFPFEKKISLGFAPLTYNDEVEDRPLSDYGKITTDIAGMDWPMTRCLQDGTTEAEVS